MTWNKGCRDMLAVGYGQFEFEKQRGGLLAFWSLKNPQFPEWTISTEQGVTALDFSAASPNLLAGGLGLSPPCAQPTPFQQSSALKLFTQLN